MAVQFISGQVLFVGGQVAMDPACCCDVSLGCCPYLPHAIYATFEDAGGCSCLDGLVVQLDFDGTDTYTGTATLGTCGRDVTVSLQYLSVFSNPPCNLNFESTIHFDDGCVTDFVNSGLISLCEPLSILLVPLTGSGGTCCSGNPFNAFVSFTE